MGRLNVLLRWLNVIVILFTFLSFLAPFVSPETFWPLTFLGLFFPYLVLINLLFIFFWAIRKKWLFVLSAACLLVGWNQVRSIVGLSLSEGSANIDRGISVLSFNVHSFRDYDREDHPASEERIKELFDIIEADVYCLQETKYGTDLVRRLENTSYQYRLGR
ncbi:MAG: hypothetical protein R3350_07645, partial [Saprospiraceae bacterium]|nr:hypothetical protein [Saprospiraceae bacterium]